MTAHTDKPEAKEPAPKVDSKKPAGKDVNKSEEIHKIAAAMKADGKKPRPVLIIDALKKRGIVASSPQVSMVLKKMGFRPRKRRKTRGRAELSPPVAKKTSRVKVEDLVKAKKVAAHMGGIDRALAALEALRDFE